MLLLKLMQLKAYETTQSYNPFEHKAGQFSTCMGIVLRGTCFREEQQSRYFHTRCSVQRSTKSMPFLNIKKNKNV